MNRRWLADAGIVGLILIGQLVAADLIPQDRPFTAGGAVLVVLMTLPLLGHRRFPLPVLITHFAVALPYHYLEFPHEAVFPSSALALYTVARHGNRRRTAIVTATVAGMAVAGIMLSRSEGENSALAAFGAFGWIVLACVAGEAVRLQRAYIAEVLDRADRAERSRDEEARRQVTEERLRIARDLHDLLAHTITVIQVQAGVAGHLLAASETDSGTVGKALETISDACTDARAELLATVGVLRSPAGGADAPGSSREPLPALARVRVLAEPAEAAGVTVEFVIDGRSRELPPTVEMVGYRIVQEALTNVAKHADATLATVRLDYRVDGLVIRVRDNGAGTRGSGMHGTAHGFGILGMCERAEAIGGTVSAADTGDGFEVTAVLPCAGPVPAAHREGVAECGALRPESDRTRIESTTPSRESSESWMESSAQAPASTAGPQIRSATPRAEA
ncbi:sensor histidine kinase [Nocardia sp. NPDC055321]